VRQQAKERKTKVKMNQRDKTLQHEKINFHFFIFIFIFIFIFHFHSHCHFQFPFEISRIANTLPKTPSLTLGKSKIPKHSNSWDQQNQQKTPNIDYYCHLKMIRNSLVPANANT